MLVYQRVIGRVGKDHNTLGDWATAIAWLRSKKNKETARQRAGAAHATGGCDGRRGQAHGHSWDSATCRYMDHGWSS